MASNRLSPNQREALSAVSTITNKQEYLSSTNNILNVNASVSISGVATAANQTNGAQKTQIVDSLGNVVGETANALDVNIKSGSASGTQYADGTARGTATGTLMMVDDGTNIQSAAGTTAGVLKVDLSATTANTTPIAVTIPKTFGPITVENSTVAGNDIVTTAPGVALTSLAGPTGDPINTTGDALDVAVRNAVTIAGGTLAVTKNPGSTLPIETNDYYPVRQLPPTHWRSGFDATIAANGVDPVFNTLIVTGSGQTVSQASSSLLMAAGTTANSESIVRSVQAFRGDFAIRAAVTLSQRIAGNNFFVELVDVIGDNLPFTINSSTSVTITFPNSSFTAANIGQSMWVGNLAGVASVIPGRYAIASIAGNAVTFTVAGWPSSGSGTCSLFGWNYYHVLYDGASLVNAKFSTQRNGWSSGDLLATVNPPTATHVFGLSGSSGISSFSDQTGLSSTTLELVERATTVRNVPAEETPLYIQFRSLNGPLAPASSTTFTVGFVDMDQFSTTPVTLQTIAPQSLNQPLPTQVNNTVAINPTQIAGSTISTGSGPADAGTQRVTLSNTVVQINNAQIAGADVLTVKDGVPLMALAGPFGDPLDTTGDSLNVAVKGNASIVGNVAAGVTDSGNPVKVGGKYNSIPPVLSNGQRGDLQVDSSARLLVSTAPLSSGTDTVGILAVSTENAAVPTSAIYLGIKNGSGNLAHINSVDNVGDNNNLTNNFPVALYGENSGSLTASGFFDYYRLNEDVTLLASAARTTTQTSADLTNFNGISALIVVLDMTVVGTGSVTLSIQGKDQISGKYYTILTGAAIITNSTNIYRVGPNIAAATNSIAQDYLPRTFRIIVTANVALAATYSVGYSLVR